MTEDGFEPTHEDRLRASLLRLEALVEHATDPILVIDEDRRVAYLSPAASDFLGSDQVTAEDLLSRLHHDDATRARRLWQELLDGDLRTTRMLLRLERADGRPRQLLTTFTDLRDNAAVGGIVVSSRDLTDELTARARLEHQTTHDDLTGLANRELLIEELRTATDPRQRRGVGLVLLDLLGMSGVNERVGLRTGDLLLRAVAQRLSEEVADGATVARTSGDEFAVLVHGPTDACDPVALGERFVRLFDQPFVTPGGGTVLLRAQVGAAAAISSETTPAGLLRDATLALSAAREDDGSAVRVCGPQLRAAEERRLAMEYELATPGVVDGLTLVFQPVMDLREDRVCGFEALVRWQHERFGLVEPEEFVPVAERNGTIVPIGSWVLHAATDQLATWDAAGVTTDECLAINVSARQLLDIDLAPTFERALIRTGIDPGRLILEITETALADESTVTNQTVAALADLGAAIHIDDFGMGYSSFSQLARFPFQGLKIDRSFVTPLGVSDGAVPMLTAMLNLARAQGLEVTAEGVEHAAQALQLRALGCGRGQGYHWSRPLSADDVPSWLQERERETVRSADRPG